MYKQMIVNEESSKDTCQWLLALSGWLLDGVHRPGILFHRR